MKTENIARYVACFAAGLLSAGAVSAAPMFGPKGEFKTMFFTLEWSPERSCHKPYRPLSRDQYSMDAYRQDGIRYLDCAKDAAASDMDYATEVVADGYKKSVDDFLKELKGGY